jgi:hypothetical protein
MERDGVVKFGKSLMPSHWQKVFRDMRKGRMTALSIALAVKYPQRLNEFSIYSSVTDNDQRTLRNSIESCDLRETFVASESLATPMCGSSINEVKYIKKIVCYLKSILPEYPVTHHYIAVRMLLSCPNENLMVQMAKDISRGFYHVRSYEGMTGWWHSVPDKKGKNATFYSRPKLEYDL